MIGNFLVERRLGEGGMGSVYAGLHPTLGRRVAIKVVHPTVASDPTHVDRFVNEARAASAIGHPGLVQVFDFGTLADGRRYSVMEHLDGQDLERRLRKRGPLAPLRVAELGRQIADALAAAHERGIVHRDLKPSNLILSRAADGRDSMKIIDFGIASCAGQPKLAEGSGDGMVLGTPQYLSPEQACGAADVDGRADVYSLGVVLYELLTGRPPFEHKQPMQVMRAHVQDRPESLLKRAPHVPRALADIVMKCLAKRRGARFQSMRELRDALARVREAARARAAPSPAPAPVRTRRTTKLLLASLVALALGASVGVAWQGGDADAAPAAAARR